MDVRGANECWPWRGARDKNGYGKLKWDDVTLRAHRVAYEVNIGALGDLQALHRCDTPACNNPAHLWKGTNAENHDDKMAKGREAHAAPRGERSPFAKLTEAKVREIRARRDEGATLKSLADSHGVRVQTVHDIVTRKKWRHVS